ncbi:radical SAM/SPASM domain-containing protein [Fusicatenibacter saccharivorans]|uniref:radical SAM protein n=1 Tax=Fusicatenibacter saccharivorans TaxID=1150298 RepID=UPI002A9AC63C|nr:radical SAM protein [bacterium]MDY5456265.1 radical SAM protein [Bariatricus sp.]
MENLKDTNNPEEILCKNATINCVPINAILELTPLCNMNCDMCFVRLSPKEQRNIGRLRSLEEWMSVAKEMQKAGTLFVLLTGGEPLLYPDFRELYIYLKKLGMIITINTNGTLLNEEWADFFAKYKPRRINITIYGKDSNTYDRLCHYADGFEKAVHAIQLLKERKVDVKLNGSITPSNAEDGLELTRLAKQLDVPWKIDTYMYPGSRERNQSFNENARLTPSAAAKMRICLMQRKNADFEEFAKNFIERAEKTSSRVYESMSIPCRAGRSSFAINWQGYMRPCIMVTKPQTSVFSQDFMSGWRKIVEDTARIKLSSKCSACTMREVCQTCAACALLETGSYDGTPKYMCQYTENTIQQLKKYLKEKREDIINE